jgi:hypothetical protein
MRNLARADTLLYSATNFSKFQGENQLGCLNWGAAQFSLLGNPFGFRAPRLNSSVLAGEQKTGEAPFFLLRYWE